MKNISLSTSYLGLTLRNPLIVSSSGLTASVNKIKQMEKAGAGAVVLKSLFEEQINYNAHRIEDSSTSDYPEATDYIRAYNKSNSIQQYINLITEAKQALNIPVIASISCISSKDWIDFAQEIEKAGADALELNLFLLPSDKDRKGESYEAIYYDLVDKLKACIKIPVAIKIGFYFSNPVNIVKELYFHKADAVVLFNKFYESDIDIDNMKMIPSQVFSNESDLRLSLRWVSLISAQVPQIQLSASTGVHDGKALVKQLLAGATTVQVCSTLYKNGIDEISKIISFLEEWMKRHNFSSIDDFRGKMNYKNIANPQVYERAQFMKYYSGKTE